MVFLGHYFALEGQFSQLSEIERILNLLILPVITSYWNTIFLYHVTIVMILALAQKLIERLEKVPEKEVDIWIFDSLTLFNKFEQKMSQYCFFIIPAL